MSEEFGILYKLVFFSTVVLLVLLERVHVFQRQPVGLETRWTTNIGLFLIDSVLVRVVMPLGIFAFALDQPRGVLSRSGLPFAAQLLLTFLFLDLWRYWEHRLFHWTPFLWRVHLVHHSDTQIDATTSERHHPLETLLGTTVMMALVVVLGLPAQALGLYLLTEAVIALCSHANLCLPVSLERRLSWLIVTPGVHAVHHSALLAQTDSNYGSVLTIWDRLFGSYVDPQHAPIKHFGLDYFHQAKDTGLTRVLLQPFLFRSEKIYPSRNSGMTEPKLVAATAAESSGAAMAPGWRDALLGAMAGCVLVSLVLWPTMLELASSWRNNEAYQYAWLVLPMVVYLLGWHFRQEILAIGPQPDLTGVFVAFAAAVCWGAAALMNINVGRQFAFVLALQGVAMSALGWRLYWRLFPTLALMFLMIPSGDLLQPVLRLLTVKSIELVAVVVNLPHSVEGFDILIGKHLYVVVDACSGLSYVTLTIFLGYCFGLLLYRSVFKIAAMTLFGAFLGIFSNVLRVNAIVLIDWVRGSQMNLTAHGDIQWMALVLALVLLFYVLGQLKADAAPAMPVINAPGQARPVRRFAPVVAGLSVLLIAGIVTGLPTDARRPQHGLLIDLLPINMSGWELTSPGAAWSIDPQGDTESLNLTYRRNGQDMRVVVIETLSLDAKLPESRLAPSDQKIWREAQLEKQTSCVASNCLTLLHSTWKRGKKQQLRHVYYAYSIGSFSTDSKLALRAAHGWHRLTGNRTNPRLIGFILDGAAPSGDDLAEEYRWIQSALEASKAASPADKSETAMR